MTPISELRKSLQQAGLKIQQASADSNIQPRTEESPAQLASEIDELLGEFDALDQEHGERAMIATPDVSAMGEEIIGSLGELGLLADRLELEKESHVMDDLVLEITHWLIRHRAEIRALEPVVNALAIKANHHRDPKVLTSLFYVLKDVIEHTAPEISHDLDKFDLDRPWRMLNFNYAIVATRTQNRALMEKAFDTLGRNLPDDCPQFFAEGLKQSERPEYGAEIREMMAEYFKKWVVRH
ncbi:MAG TPA: hypothetical protein VIU93_01685 [Gallionellaceae bacterium]